MSTALAKALQECKFQEKELQQLQETHRLYLQKLEEVSKLQKSFAASIARQKKNLKENLKGLIKFNKGLTEEEKNEVKEAKDHIQNMQSLIFQMEAFLPKKNGIYLNLVLGSMNVNLPSKETEFTQVCLTHFPSHHISCLSLLCVCRVVDALLNFLLVWYYCTLTIRESILISNGSRIKGWWVFHHYISTFLSGVMLTWPDGETYQSFRNQFLAYCLYQSFVQYLQYYYQSGCLYRLKALGERHNLDLTVEGFQSWMWRGLTFLLPFLFLGHVIAITFLFLFLFLQVSMCGFCFLVLFVGNFFTTLAVVRHKRKNQQKTKSL
uniref:Zgc:103681 n=1 Tax=Cyprinus carpio TaxID=7962 RepID=A0A8C2JCZ9_CYPCA